MTWQPEDRAIQAERAMQRALAITVPCAHCGAGIGRECVNRVTGERVAHQSAHFRRLQDVGL